MAEVPASNETIHEKQHLALLLPASFHDSEPMILSLGAPPLQVGLIAKLSAVPIEVLSA